MTVRTRIAFLILWVISLVAVGVIATAQTRTTREPAAVLSGTDIGFRPDGWRGKARTGTWVVRINGEWVDAVASFGPQPATTR
jgi:hypothetical protein